MKRMFVCIVLFLIFVLLSTQYSSLEKRGSDDWPQFMHDNLHSNFSDSQIAKDLVEIGRIKISEPWTSSPWEDFGSPIIAGDKLFISSDRGLLAYNLDNMTEIWRYEGGDAESIPTYKDNFIYLANGGGITKFDANSGEVIWKRKIGGWLGSSPAIEKNILVTGTNIGGAITLPMSIDLDDLNDVVAVDIETSNEIWRFSADSSTPNSPATFNNTVYVSSIHKVYALDLNSGKELWDYGIDDIQIYSSPLIYRERIFVISWNGMVYCLDINTGKELWRFATKVKAKGEEVFECQLNSLAAGYDKIIVTPDGGNIFNGGTVFVLNYDDGRLLWKRRNGVWVYPSPIVADNKVFIASYSNILILNPKNGHVINKYGFPELVTSLVIADGKLFVGCRNGMLYIYGSKQRISRKIGHDQAIIILILGIILMRYTRNSFLWK